MCGLLLVCAEIREAAARGGYSNFGPWADHSQALPLDTRAPRPNESGVAKSASKMMRLTDPGHEAVGSKSRRVRPFRSKGSNR
jgi:hypothetical protein